MTSKKTVITITPLLLVSVIGLGVWYYFSTKEILPQIAQVSRETGSVNLKLEPANVTVAVNTEATINMTIDTTSAKVTAAAVELAYNPAKLQVTSVVPADFLTVILAQPTVANGKINFALGAPPASGGKQGTGNLATIKVKPLTTEQSTLRFTDKTEVAAIGSNNNELKSATDATISTPGPSPTPTPSPSPSPSPAASASPSPAASPSPLASPSPSPAASASPSPAASPSPLSSPSPSPFGAGGMPLASPSPRPISSPTSLPAPLVSPTPSATLEPSLPTKPKNIFQALRSLWENFLINIYNFFASEDI